MNGNKSLDMNLSSDRERLTLDRVISPGNYHDIRRAYKLKDVTLCNKSKPSLSRLSDRNNMDTIFETVDNRKSSV